MSSKTTTSNISAADLSLLTIVFASTLLGNFLSVKPAFFWYWTVVFVLLESGFLWWAVRPHPGTAQRKLVAVFAFKTQLHIAAQILTVLVAMFATLTVLAVLGGQHSPLIAFFTSAGALSMLAMWTKVTVISSLGLAFARFHYFHKHGMDVPKLADGSFLQATVLVAAPVQAANKALLHHLEKLQHSTTPKFTRQFYDANVEFKQLTCDEQPAYRLQWSMCPCDITIVLVAAGATSTELQVKFGRRGGMYQVEPFVNPVDVHLLMNYMQLHVFQALSSEITLSKAVIKQDALRHQALESQLRILQAQIEPHFLFNTLANVRHLYRSSLEAGEEMMDHLIVYLRSTLEELRSDASTVGKEMDLILHYLAIMKIRMGERLSYGFIIPDTLAQHSFPPAMLISLVENAIKHGLHDKQNGKLTISCERVDQYLRVSVADNGAGCSSVQGTGVGLSNIRQRLEAMYGRRAWLEVGAATDGGFISSVMVPFDADQ